MVCCGVFGMVKDCLWCLLLLLLFGMVVVVLF